MIKKLQALKAKKGFTLVELIVVIAIIGVLAAILVPTMLGYVTSSRVTSANSTASSLKNTVNAWLTDVDTKGYSTDKSKDTTPLDARNILILADTSGNVTVAFNAAEGGAGIWSSTASSKADDLGALLADKLEADMTLSNCYAVCYFNQGKVMSVCYGTGVCTEDDLPAMPGAGDFAGGTYAWSDTDGITSNGDVVGTSPQLIKPLFGEDAGDGNDTPQQTPEQAG